MTSLRHQPTRKASQVVMSRCEHVHPALPRKSLRMGYASTACTLGTSTRDACRRGDPGRVDRLKDTIPMGRGGQPEEVVRAILWRAPRFLHHRHFPRCHRGQVNKRARRRASRFVIQPSCAFFAAPLSLGAILTANASSNGFSPSSSASIAASRAATQRVSR